MCFTETKLSATCDFCCGTKASPHKVVCKQPCYRPAVESSGNILLETAVDLKICYPTKFDLYVCNHVGIQGTSRPAHYHMLWDENKFIADGSITQCFYHSIVNMLYTSNIVDLFICTVLCLS